MSTVSILGEQDWQTVCGSVLFAGISTEDAKALCACLQCTVQKFFKGEAMLRQGEPVPAAGLLLCGSAIAESIHADGTRSVHAVLQAGKVFGEVVMSADGMESPVTVCAQTVCTVLFLPGERVMDGCAKNCAAHTLLRRNLQKEIAEKYWALNRRLRYLSCPNLRRKITEYLSDCAIAAGQKTYPFSVTLPYSREQLAAFLGANRSALCRELSAMRRDGLLSYRKNVFFLYQTNF